MASYSASGSRQRMPHSPLQQSGCQPFAVARSEAPQCSQRGSASSGDIVFQASYPGKPISLTLPCWRSLLDVTDAIAPKFKAAFDVSTARLWSLATIAPTETERVRNRRRQPNPTTAAPLVRMKPPVRGSLPDRKFAVVTFHFAPPCPSVHYPANCALTSANDFKVLS